MSEGPYVQITIHFRHAHVREYVEEKVLIFREIAPAIPLVGEKLLVNLADEGEVADFGQYIVEKRAFGLVAGFVRTMDNPRGDHVEMSMVDLYVRPATAARVPGDSERVSSPWESDPW